MPQQDSVSTRFDLISIIEKNTLELEPSGLWMIYAYKFSTTSLSVW